MVEKADVRLQDFHRGWHSGTVFANKEPPLCLELHHLTCLHHFFFFVIPAQGQLESRCFLAAEPWPWMATGITPSPALGSRTPEASKALRQVFLDTSKWCFLLWLHLNPTSLPWGTSSLCLAEAREHLWEERGSPVFKCCLLRREEAFPR